MDMVSGLVKVKGIAKDKVKRLKICDLFSKCLNCTNCNASQRKSGYIDMAA
jgi:hypothetical protein